MKEIKNYLRIQILLSAIFVIALAACAFGQKSGETTPASLLSVGFGGTENGFQLAETPRGLTADEPEKLPVRKRFQKRVTITPNGLGFNIVAMQIPAGKRFVIEKVSAVVRCAEKQLVEAKYFTYSNDGNGVPRMKFHGLALQRRGSFNGLAIFAANQKVRVFADEQIGAEHFSVGVSARLNRVGASFAQAQFTFSGYLEDLPAV